MAEYYAVERSPEYLAHIGVKGMRWGVRKRRKELSNENRKALLAIADRKAKPAKDRRPLLTRMLLNKQDIRDASKAAALSLFMGAPAASIYVSSRRSVTGPSTSKKRDLSKADSRALSAIASNPEKYRVKKRKY